MRHIFGFYFITLSGLLGQVLQVSSRVGEERIFCGERDLISRELWFCVVRYLMSIISKLGEKVILRVLGGFYCYY